MKGRRKRGVELERGEICIMSGFEFYKHIYLFEAKKHPNLFHASFSNGGRE